MEVLAALAVLLIAGATWIAPLAIALVGMAANAREHRALRQRIADLEAGRAPAPPPLPEELETDEAPEAPEVPEVPEAPPSEPTPEPPPPRPARPPWKPPSPEKVVVWIAASAGGLTVLLAALLGLVAVLEQGWLGPSTRIAGGLVGGVALWIGGAILRRRLPVVAAALSGGGAGTLYGSLFAAHGVYHLLPRWVVFVLLTAVAGVATLRAARLRSRFMAYLGLIGALLTPVLVSSGENRAVAFFAYLVLVVSGSVLAAIRRGWWDLVVAAALGAGALYLSWTTSWYVADQAPVALLGAAGLALPFALAAARRSPAVAIAGTVGAVGLPLLALPWLVPIDPVFSDPRSFDSVVRPLGAAAWWAAAGTALLPLPALLGTRLRGHWGGAFAAALLAGLAGLVATIGWLTHPDPPSVALVVAAVLPLATATVVFTGARDAGRGLLLLPVLAGAGLSMVATAVEVPSGAALAGGAAALVVTGAVGARISSSGWMLLATLAGASLALFGAGARVDELGLRPILGPAVLAYGLLSSVPLLVRWPRHPAAPWTAAALSGPLLFPPLYLAWQSGLGDTLIGVLPVLLGLNAVLAGAVLVRVHHVQRSDWIVALFVGVALLGVTSAVPVQLEEQWLTVAWALEAAALAAVARRITHPLLQVFSAGLCVVVGIRLLGNPAALAYGTAEGWPVLNWTLYTWGVPFVSLLATARGLRAVGATSPLRFAPPAIVCIALLVGFALVDVQVSHAFQDAGPIELGGHSLLQGMVRSMAWAGYGLAVLFAGFVRDSRAVRFIGFAFVLVAAGKVFVFDLWDLSGFARVGSLAALAATLLVAAFAFERLVLRKAPDLPPAGDP